MIVLEIYGDEWGFHQGIWWIVEVSASLLESTSHTVNIMGDANMCHCQVTW